MTRNIDLYVMTDKIIDERKVQEALRMAALEAAAEKDTTGLSTLHGSIVLSALLQALVR